VPVREDWLETIADYGLRLSRGLRRNVNEKKTALSAARLPRLEGVLAAPQQRLDLAVARLPKPVRLFEPLRQRLALATSNFPSLGRLLDGPKTKLAMAGPQQDCGLSRYSKAPIDKRKHSPKFRNVQNRRLNESLSKIGRDWLKRRSFWMLIAIKACWSAVMFWCKRKRVRLCGLRIKSKRARA